MGCNVFANGDEIACKSGANKVIAEFPDVCLSPAGRLRPDTFPFRIRLPHFTRT